MANESSFDISELHENGTQSEQLKEELYQQAFEELSAVRSQLRVAKQQNQWLKNAKAGLEEEVQAMRDILQQKKAIISKMTLQLQQRVHQLEQADRQITDLLQQNETLVTELEKVQTGSQQLQKQIQEQQDRIAQQDVMLISTSQPPLTDKVPEGLTPIRSVKNSPKVSSPSKQQIILPRLNEQITKTMSYIESISSESSEKAQLFKLHTVNSSSGIIQGFQKLITLNGELISSCESLRRDLEIVRSSDKQTKKETKQIKQLLFQTEKNHNLLKQQGEKNKLLARQFGQRVNWLEQELQRTKKQYEKDSLQLREKVDQLSKQNHSLRKQSNWLPILRPFLPQGLPELVKQLLSYDSKQPRASVLEKQIQKMASLQLCQQKHNQTLEQNYKHTKSELLRFQGENEILAIKLSNMERAYEHAIDDYRRAIRFGTAKSKRMDYQEGSSKHKTSIWASNKQNRNWNYQ